MQETENKERIPDLPALIRLAVLAPHIMLEECQGLAKSLKEKRSVSELAKILISSTVAMTDEFTRNQLPEIFQTLLNSVDSWDMDNKKSFGRQAAQACANAHQIAAKYLYTAPASLREISAKIDRHTERMQSQIIDFQTAATALTERGSGSNNKYRLWRAPAASCTIIELTPHTQLGRS